MSFGAHTHAHTSLGAHTSAHMRACASLGTQTSAHTSAHASLGAYTSAHTSALTSFGAHTSTHRSLGAHTSPPMCAFLPEDLTSSQAQKLPTLAPPLY